MNPRYLASDTQQQQSRILLVFMVVVGYLATFVTAANGGEHYSIPQVIIGVAFGVIYLIMGMFDAELLGRFSEKTGHAIYFVLQCLLVFGIGMLLGPGGSWLIGLPLAGIAVERFSSRWRWAVYIGVLVAIVLPIAYHSTLGDALMNGAIISTAIFFVVLFTQLRLNEQHARESAEGLTRQLESANHQLMEYASQAEELAATKERNRLAREIHDNLGHYLTIVNVQIEAARITCESDHARALDALNKAQELAKRGLDSVRESVSSLRVSPVENRLLEEALVELIDETKGSGIKTDFKVIGKPNLVEPKTALALYRVVQEGLTNVRKHSGASKVDVKLDFSHVDMVRLTLRDNGTGAADTSGGFGLIGLSERVQLLGGELKIQTQPDQGFELEVTVPRVEGNVA